jgi:hypothetical protein
MRIRRDINMILIHYLYYFLLEFTEQYIGKFLWDCQVGFMTLAFKLFYNDLFQNHKLLAGNEFWK